MLANLARIRQRFKTPSYRNLNSSSKISSGVKELEAQLSNIPLRQTFVAMQSWGILSVPVRITGRFKDRRAVSLLSSRLAKAFVELHI